jgi:hypothetical protein
MKIQAAVLAGLCVQLLMGGGLAAPIGGLPRSSPEAQGVQSEALLGFLEAADEKIDSLHSFMMLRRGEVVAEAWWAPYAPEVPHVMFSLSKSFASTAAGLAIAEGKFSLDDPIVKFFPDDVPADVSGNLKAMRVRDLLRMNTGHETEPPRTEGKSWKKVFLEHPVKFKPGTHFLYNTSATYMVAAIVEKTTGMALLDYLQPRLLEPIGITDARWDKSPEGITLGGYGLNIKTEDIARFGQLYLQRGKWHSKQLLPASWVDEATGFRTSNGSSPMSDWDQGYGYQFWRSRHGYRGDGAFGQYCIVMPEQEVVIAITSGLGNMQAVLDLVYEKILPGMKEGTLPENKAGNERLAAKAKGLSLRVAKETAKPGEEALGKIGKVYEFGENRRELESVSFMKGSSDGAMMLVAKFDGVESRIPVGNGTWTKSEAKWSTDRRQRVAASGGWTADDTFTAKICLYETPFVHTVSLKFEDEELHYESNANVAFGPTKDAELVGKVRN